jgi:putative sterol carrier protein
MRSMPDVIEEFFTELGSRGNVESLARASGSVLFELGTAGKTDPWTVSVDKGDVSVDHRATNADCVIRADKEIFAKVLSGEMNTMAALLRGSISGEYRKNPELIVLIQRIFPTRESVKAGERA